ncbi:MAG: hypothetical protein AB7O67_17715 [Vicinamibacterales bacterium]
MRGITAVVLTLMLGAAQVAAAQQADTQQEDQTIDPTKLGVSIDRIQKRLDGQARAAAADSPLKLDFRVDVVGFAPKIDFFRDFNLNTGPVPWGAPTHSDMLDMVTPQEFRAPAMPLQTIAWWAGMQIYQKVQAHNCAQELKEYRAKIEAGEKALVPVCAQR